MALDLNGFMHSLGMHLASRTSLVYLAASARAIWVHGVDEMIPGLAADPYTVLRMYAGAGTDWEPLPKASIQVMTTGAIAAALNRAQSVFEALLDSDGHPIRKVDIVAYTPWASVADGHWRIQAVKFAQRPGLVSMDENRANVGFNMDVDFCRLAS